MPRRTTTSSFGTTSREGHDATKFYRRNLYTAQPGNGDGAAAAVVDSGQADGAETQVVARELATGSVEADAIEADGLGAKAMGTDGFGADQAAADPGMAGPVEWRDCILCRSAERMPIPDNSIGLAFTSPPYNVGKDYEGDMTLEEYLALIERVAAEVYRVLVPGGRYVVNIANLGRKPYIPLHHYFYQVHGDLGFLPMGEIIWRKSAGSNNNCAWGSWRSARSPRLRDIHEYLLVFAKGGFSRPDKGVSDVSGDEFMAATLSVWELPAESARKVGHPAPFPVALAERVIRLYSYVGDVVLDPFAGSGTTCVAAARLARHYTGFDISPAYCDLARRRLAAEQ